MLTSGHSCLDDRIFYKEAVSLRRAYDDVSVVGMCDRAGGEIRGIKIFGLNRGRGLLGRLRVLAKLYGIGSRLSADVYHCHEIDALFVGLLLKLVHGAGLIYDCHEYYPETFGSMLPWPLGKLAERFILFLEWLLSGFADYVITVCDELGSKFRNWGRKCKVVPNYSLRFSPKGYHDSGRKKSPLGIYVGGLYRERGIYELIDAISMLRDRGTEVEMLFVGPGKGNFIDLASSYVKSKGVSDIVRFTGAVPFIEIPRYLRMGDFGVVMDYPERRKLNTVAVKVFEYMSAGLPVIASDLPAYRDVILPSGCGLLADPLDPGDIASTIEKLIRNPRAMEEMGMRGMEAFNKRYSWDIAEAELLSVYRSLGRNTMKP